MRFAAVATLVASAVVLAGATGCSKDAPDASASSAAPSVSSPSAAPSGFEATASAAQMKAAKSALKSYEKYLAAVVAARANPEVVPPELRKWSNDQALAGELAWLMTMQEQGIQLAGEPVSDPQVQDVDLDKKVVVITDCQDNSDSTPIDAKTGESRAAPGQSPRVWKDVQVRWYDNRWTVMKAKSDRSREC